MNVYPLAHLLWIVPLALMAVYVGSPRFLGSIARTRVRRVLRAALDPRQYTVLDDLTLPAGGGTVHIDIIVVSRFGVFVVDAIHRTGRISGTKAQARWVEQRFGRARRFDNPVHVNFLHVQAVERLLGLPPNAVHGLVAISGRDRLDRDLPAEVVTVRQLVVRIRRESRPQVDAEQANRALQRLEQQRLRPTWRESGRGWKWLRVALILLLVGGSYAVYRPQLHEFAATVQRQADWRMAPENFHPDGRPKSERERWEDRLVCSYSVDTGRCACYEPRGDRADVDAARCRELAERGSVLQR